MSAVSRRKREGPYTVSKDIDVENGLEDTGWEGEAGAK